MAPALDKATDYADTADVYDLSLLGCDNWLICAINVIRTRRWVRRLITIIKSLEILTDIGEDLLKFVSFSKALEELLKSSYQKGLSSQSQA